MRIASRPPDADHQYGHGKAESLAALVQTLALLGLSVFLTVRAVEKNINSIFTKLDLAAETEIHKRVKAVLVHLSTQH